MCRERDILGSERLEVDRHLPCGLHGIEMQGNFLACRNGGDFLNGENNACLVIRPEKRDDGSFGRDGRFKVIGIKLSPAVNGKPGDFVAAGREVFAELDRGAVLHG